MGCDRQYPGSPGPRLLFFLLCHVVPDLSFPTCVMGAIVVTLWRGLKVILQGNRPWTTSAMCQFPYLPGLSSSGF